MVAQHLDIMFILAQRRKYCAYNQKIMDHTRWAPTSYK